MRNTIVEDALVYFENVAPIAKKVFGDVYSIFDLLGELETVDDFFDNLEILIEDAKEMSKKIEFVKILHEETMVTAKSRAIEAEKLVEELKIDMKIAEEKANAFRA